MSPDDDADAVASPGEGTAVVHSSWELEGVGFG